LRQLSRIIAGGDHLLERVGDAACAPDNAGM
jgi:hypothetical protein